MRGYVASEISALNEHLFKYGVTSIKAQQSPNRVLWMTTEEGPLLAATYDKCKRCLARAKTTSAITVWLSGFRRFPGADVVTAIRCG